MGASYYQEEEFGVAEEIAKKVLSKMTCTTHKKKARVSFDYDNLGNNAYIKKACCSEFIKEVSDALAETKQFHKIEVKPTALE